MSLIWLLWPSDLSFIDNPEAWAALVGAFVVWHFTEFKLSEELGSSQVSQNDVRVARELVELHAGQLRGLLKDADLWALINSDRYTEVHSLLNRWKRGTFMFHNKTLNTDLNAFMKQLDALSSKISQDTVPEMVGGQWRTGYKPVSIVSQQEYHRLMSESKSANAIAGNTWVLLDQIVEKIRTKIPEVWDQPVD
ncbi:hypothetical protein [Pontivivens ytuae]|uniref:Uncharacterized protein n=1 Tax=Pontivivens ytuae TaxID=2789856 RepID=A0A7S9LPU4_9RHOB|nr:hypothetical protein [Pontivivens ytuae]QPH52530.1 hypothetical protein I0K15_11910 [Pontivivens ytuae]